MSEFWVSKKKYWCKYCEIFIADDAPSRAQHENGLRHQGNKDRFIRGLYKAGEKKKKDHDEEMRDMARVEMAAQAAFAQDISAGRAKPTASTLPVASSSSSDSQRKKSDKPSDPFANYSTAASLGYVDEDAEIAAAEAAIRESKGVMGEWQVVGIVPRPVEVEEPVKEEMSHVKRAAQDVPVDPSDTRHFKLRKRDVAPGLSEIYDPGVISIKIKKKEEVDENALILAENESHPIDLGLPTASSLPKWTTTKWKKPGDAENTPDTDTTAKLPLPLKAEDGHVSSIPGVLFKDEPKVEELPVLPQAPSLFKKRKLPPNARRKL